MENSTSLILPVALILPNLGGWAGAFSVKNNLEWYDSIEKAPWSPPPAVFGPVWTGLYSGMGYASYLVYRDGGGFKGKAKYALSLYAAQLALNWAWTPLFFSYRSPKLALVDMAILGATAGACTYAFYQINPTAGHLMLPYMAWLGVATSLNYYAYRYNNETIPDKRFKKHFFLGKPKNF